MSKAQELLMEITDEALRNKIAEAVKLVEREAGERGNDLLALKEKNRELERKLSSNPDTSYVEAFEALKKQGVQPKDIPKVLERLKIQKTQEDEFELLKGINAENTKALQEAQLTLKAYQNKERLKELIPKLKAELKDANGKPIDLIEKFIDVDGLSKTLSDDLAVASEQVKKGLTDGLAKQIEMATLLGHPSVRIPAVNGDFQQNPGITPTDIQKVVKEQGPAAGFAAYRMAANQG